MRKKEAIAEGRRACELLPAVKDAVIGPSLLNNLAQIYAWTGQTAAAVETLVAVLRVPYSFSYGALKLDSQ